MSFKDYDKKTFIIDTARDFAARRISKRDFLRKTGMAGIGFSAFASGLLGSTRPFRAPARPRSTPGRETLSLLGCCSFFWQFRA